MSRPSPCDIYCFEPGQEQALHSHDENDKIHCVLEGRGTFTVGGESRELDAGWAVLCPPGEDHGVVNSSDGRLVVLVFNGAPPVAAGHRPRRSSRSRPRTCRRNSPTSGPR